MPQLLKSTEERNDKIEKHEGLHAFEANAPMGADWPTGLTVEIDIQSPIQGEEEYWDNLHTFSEKGTWQTYLVRERVYRVVASEDPAGVWVWLNKLTESVIDVRAR